MAASERIRGGGKHGKKKEGYRGRSVCKEARFRIVAERKEFAREAKGKRGKGKQTKGRYDDLKGRWRLEESAISATLKREKLSFSL